MSRVQISYTVCEPNIWRQRWAADSNWSLQVSALAWGQTGWLHPAPAEEGAQLTSPKFILLACFLSSVSPRRSFIFLALKTSKSESESQFAGTSPWPWTWGHISDDKTKITCFQLVGLEPSRHKQSGPISFIACWQNNHLWFAWKRGLTWKCARYFVLFSKKNVFFSIICVFWK